MSTAELKINIINQITELKDNRIVEEIQRLLDFELNSEPYILSENQKLRIEKARKEFNDGQILSEHQANDDIESWLQEK